jgi:hypothetical protein
LAATVLVDVMSEALAEEGFEMLPGVLLAGDVLAVGTTVDEVGTPQVEDAVGLGLVELPDDPRGDYAG